MNAGTDNGNRLTNMFDICTQNEIDYRNIKYNPSYMFESMANDLNMIDNDLCGFLDNLGILDKSTCNQNASGIL
jgi:hypothetical protein